MFVGLIYSLVILIGWGVIYFVLKEVGFEGNIVLVDVNIKYFKLLNNDFCGSVELVGCKGKLVDLEDSGKVSYYVLVNVYDGDVLVVEFEGYFIVKK